MAVEQVLQLRHGRAPLPKLHAQRIKHEPQPSAADFAATTAAEVSNDATGPRLPWPFPGLGDGHVRHRRHPHRLHIAELCLHGHAVQAACPCEKPRLGRPQTFADEV